MPEAAVTAEVRQQLKDAEEKEHLKNVAAELKDAVQASLQIPLRTKTQFMLYPETRTLVVLKAIAKADGTTVQDFIRDAVDGAIERRLKPPRRRSKKKVNNKKGA